MTRRRSWLTIILAVALLAGAAWAITRSLGKAVTATTAPTTEPSNGDDDKPVATVQTATIHTGDLSQTLLAFGSVTAAPGAIDTMSVPADMRVVKLHVSAGQPVAKGAPLVDVEPAADTKFMLLDARNAVDATNRNQADTQQRFDLKLATNTELLQAKQAAQSAQAKLDDLQKRGIGEGVRTLNAATDSLVTKVDVQPGQIALASSPIVELLPRDQVQVQFGVEPSQVGQLKAGQSVKLLPSSGEPLAGTIATVGQRVEPDSRLVNVFVRPTGDAPPLFDSFIRGEFTLQTMHGLIVPREAVLPSDDGQILFTVKDGHAVKHAVTVSVQTDHDASVTGNGLNDGDVVITQGGLELDDGTAVSTGGEK